MNTNNGLLIGLLVVVSFGIGVYVGRVTEATPFSVGGTDYKVTTKTTGTEDTGTLEGTVEDGGTPVASTQLTDGQKKMLSALGIDPNTFTITPQMVACAEAKLGAARVEEIKNGATPSFTEGASLVACYK